MAASREIGTLIVVVLKARNLPNKRHIGKQDPYCLVSLNGEKRRTKAIKRGGQHPEWDEEIRFTLLEDDAVEQPPATRNGSPPPPPPKKDKGVMNIKGGKFMGLACYAEDLREPDLIGETKVDLTEVLTKGETDEWFTLMSKDKYCGEVYLELTFWSNEPVPAKKAPAKHKTKKNYGGPGSFVPSEGPTHSSSENLTEYSLSSRLSSSNSIQDRSRRESLPPSLRSSSSIAKIDLYTAPYETSRSHSSVSTFDSLASELGQLNVSGDLSRRTSYPPGSSGFQPRPASANGYPTPQSSQFGYSQYSHYSNEGSIYDYDQQPVSATATGFSQYSQQSAIPPQPASYHPPYETPGRPSSAYPGARGPRHSLPSASSGFMPIPASQPSGFAPVAPQNTGYYPPPVPATPAPSNYGPPASHTPPGQAPPSHLYNQHGQHNAYPPAPTPAPSSSFTAMPQYNMSPTYPQSYQPMPPSQSTYSYQYPNAHNQVQQQYPPPPMPPPTTVSAPPSMNGTGPPQSVPPPPSLPAHAHQHTGSPEHLQIGYGEQMQHPAQPHISVPPPPPLTQNVPSPVSGGGSRPLPVPGQSQVRRKPSSIGQQQTGPISPNGAQPNYNAYAQIPPPPPLPTSSSVSSLQTRPQSAVPPPSVLSQPYAPAGHQMPAIPGPPPLPPPRAPSRAPSQSQAQPQYNHVPARRHSVSHTSAIYVPPPPQPMQPPPEQHQQQQQQSAYQAVPPPPPLTYGGTTSHTLALAASSLQASQHPYPGPLPVPPQIPTSQSMHGYPVASASWQ